MQTLSRGSVGMDKASQSKVAEYALGINKYIYKTSPSKEGLVLYAIYRGADRI